MRTLLLTAAAAASVLAIGSPAAATRRPIHLYDLSEHPSVRPSRFMVTNHVAVEGLRWSGWGTPTARGRGTLRINTCTPDCARGRERVLPGAELEVRGVKADGGRRYYRQYRVVDRALSPDDRANLSQWTDVYTPADFH